MHSLRLNRLARVTCAALLSMSCLVGLAACGSSKTSDAPSSSDPTLNFADISQGVAVSVNGIEIGEASVTAYIEGIRASQGLEDDATWAEWLSSNGFTPETLRTRIIDNFVSQELLRQAAISEGVEVDSAQIDAQLESMKSMYGGEEAWEQALEQAGITKESFRNYLEQSALQDALMEKVAGSAGATDEEFIEYLNGIKPQIDGSKRSSHILFDAEDEAKAQEVLDQLSAGTLDFSDAVAQYSTDTGSAANGGDVGWDRLTSFVTEYQEGLDALGKGEMSGLVPSQFGIHIILCTDVFEAPEVITSLDQVPVEFVEQLRSTIDTSSRQSAFSDWMNAYRESAEIEVTDMPAKLSYAIDLSQYATSSQATSAAVQ